MSFRHRISGPVVSSFFSLQPEFAQRDAAHRRRGVGRRAIETFREQIVSPDQALSLEVLIHNEAGIAFWQAVGFEQHAVSFRIGPKRATV